jgi:outer membrane lipoprotein-sorting protein
MRLVRALLLSAFLLLPEVAAWSEPATPTIPEFSQANSLQITYTYLPGGPDETTPATAVVSFLAPGRVKVSDRGPSAAIAVSDGRSIRMFSPGLRAAIWVPAEYPFTFGHLAVRMGGTQGPLTTDWEAIRGGLRHRGGGGGGTTYELLPEQRIAGRKCLVLRTTMRSALPQGPKDWVTTEWFDAKYGLPLGVRGLSGQSPVELRAKSVAIDLDLGADFFRLRVPPGVPVFRGPLNCCDLNAIGAALANDVPEGNPSDLDPDSPVSASALRPAWAPAGFRSTMSPMTSSSLGPGEIEWSYSLRWFSRSGGVIAFDQGVGELEPRRPRLAGDTHPVTVRGVAGELLTYHLPFEGLVLYWEDGKQWFSLEGTGVTERDLVKMADAMKGGRPRDASKDRGGD